MAKLADFWAGRATASRGSTRDGGVSAVTVALLVGAGAPQSLVKSALPEPVASRDGPFGCSASTRPLSPVTVSVNPSDVVSPLLTRPSPSPHTQTGTICLTVGKA
jgi:hypothetical protein